MYKSQFIVYFYSFIVIIMCALLGESNKSYDNSMQDLKAVLYSIPEAAPKREQGSGAWLTTLDMVCNPDSAATLLIA